MNLLRLTKNHCGLLRHLLILSVETSPGSPCICCQIQTGHSQPSCYSSPSSLRTHKSALRCPGRVASGTKRQPLSAALLHCCCTAEPVLTRTILGFGRLGCTYDSLCLLHAVHDFLMNSASPSTTMTNHSSSGSFFFALHHPDRTRPSLWIPASFHGTPWA